MRSRSQLLIVDDDTAMREMLASLFRDRGYAVEEAASSAEALERADQQCFDVALSDIRMPGKSGFDFLREARGVAPSTPVILMTSFGTVTTADRAKREGAFDCLSKPFSREELLDTLSRALPGPGSGASDHSEALPT